MFHGGGEFWITNDAGLVADKGIMPEHTDCQRCHDGVAYALREMDADPALWVIVGQLHWTG